jgi:hypothetical protein
MLNEKTRLLQILNELKADQEKLVKRHEVLFANTAKLCSLFESLHRQFEKSSLPYQRRSSTQESAAPTRAMQEMNRNFSLQYLALQQKIQQENREFTALSNVMKARHDAAKNALNNIR